jgi:hypothetical protein
MQLVVSAALALHGIGHVVGFWLPVPLTFALLWLVPGVAFVACAYGAWTHAAWWPSLVLGAAALSAALLLSRADALQRPGPLASAFAFNALAAALHHLPRGRRLVAE